MGHKSFSEWWDEIPVLGDGLDGEDIDQDDFAELEAMLARLIDSHLAAELADMAEEWAARQAGAL